MKNRSALPGRASSSEGRRMGDQAFYGDYCRMVTESSIGSGWKHLVNVLAELDARHDSLPPRRPAGPVQCADNLATHDAA